MACVVSTTPILMPHSVRVSSAGARTLGTFIATLYFFSMGKMVVTGELLYYGPGGSPDIVGPFCLLCSLAQAVILTTLAYAILSGEWQVLLLLVVVCLIAYSLPFFGSAGAITVFSQSANGYGMPKTKRTKASPSETDFTIF